MLDFDKTYLTSMDFFLVFKGADIQPHSQWNLVDFFPNFKKNPNGFSLRLGSRTHKLHGDVLLQFNGNCMCNS